MTTAVFRSVMTHPMKHLSASLLVAACFVGQAFAQEGCDFWSGECEGTQSGSAKASPATSPTSNECDFWAGECSTATTAVKESDSDFWSKPHTAQINKLREEKEAFAAEQRRIQIAESRRRDELRELRQERDRLKREQERFAAQARQQQRPSSPQINKGAWGDFASAAIAFSNEANRQMDIIRADNARQLAAAQRQRAEYERRQQANIAARKNADIDRRIADLERQSREAEAARQAQARNQASVQEQDRRARSNSQSSDLQNNVTEQGWGPCFPSAFTYEEEQAEKKRLEEVIRRKYGHIPASDWRTDDKAYKEWGRAVDDWRRGRHEACGIEAGRTRAVTRE